MNEDAAILFRNSEKRLNKLKILSNFFDNVTLLRIFIKTRVIHDLFQEQHELDTSKLELFHIQYTDSLIELLDKLKRNNEKELLVFYTEIDSNEIFIEKFESAATQSTFETDRKYYNNNFSVFLKQVYNDLINKKQRANVQSILYFHEKYSGEFYRTEGDAMLLKNSKDIKYYEYDGLKIEKRLLGKLNIADFKTRFLCGFVLENNVYELFKMLFEEEYFVFNIYSQTIYLADRDNLDQMDISTNISDRVNVVKQLKVKNDILEEKIRSTRKYIPPNVAEVIKTYKNSLENINVLNNIFKIDEETNILKAMLNFNLNNNQNGN